MILDEFTPCPACPQVVRDLYAITRRLLAAGGPARLSIIEWAEVHQVLKTLRPFIEAHHANQLHSHSLELEDARHPSVPQDAAPIVPPVDPEGSQR